MFTKLFKYWREFFLLLALLNILDVLFTVRFLGLDDLHTEFNLVVVFLVKHFGWVGALLFKLAISAVAFWVYLEEKKRTTEERFDKFLLLIILVDVVLFFVVVSTITTIFLIK
jgi:hypothetical protein